MDGATFILTAVPPALAMFAEWRNPITTELLERQADITITALSLVEVPNPNSSPPPSGTLVVPDEKDALITAITTTAKGAVSVASLVPTAVAFLTGSVAIVHEIKNSFWIIDFILICFMMGGIQLLRYLGKKSFFIIGGSAASEHLSRVVYLVNWVLILISGYLYGRSLMETHCSIAHACDNVSNLVKFLLLI